MPDQPRRIRRRRRRGWTLTGATRNPAGAVAVDRTSRWGNPFAVRPVPGGWTVEDTASGASEGPWPTRVEAHAVAVERFRAHLDAHPELVAAARRELAGRDLACWCDDDVPCHADVWLDVANRRPGPHG